MIDLKGKSPKLLVIGDLMVDHYLWGSCERISPEAPVQVININNESILLGGAGNVVNNLKALGANVDVISVIGNCNISDELKGLIDNINIDTKFLFKQHDRITSKKSRIIASQQQVIRFDREEAEEISNESEKKILSTFTKIIKNYDSVLLSDYGKGVLTNKLTKSIITIANKNSKRVLVDPKGSDYSKYKGAYLLTPNKIEASKATGIIIKDETTLAQAVIQLKSDCDLDISIITLSDQGIAAYDDVFHIHPTFTREVFDVTGAGDTVLASLGFALACNSSIDDAIEFSNLAAGVVVGKIGSSTATINEVVEYESSLKKLTSGKHIKNINEISMITKELKARGRKIVFTNGCFDVLHAGHIKYLETSKNHGDILIVGINSNRSVSSLKGPQRPFNNETDRAYMIAALASVDYVVIFDEDTPYNLIKTIKPHILTKGADYKGKKVIGQELVEELKLIDFIDGKSTSKLVKEIQRSNKDEV
jgi:D-beta-D-heptose 7-phosphate kinase / D-beta-D-heptose 1-phosphate adenosyltransferase